MGRIPQPPMLFAIASVGADCISARCLDCAIGKIQPRLSGFGMCGKQPAWQDV
ncbi:hypothetical protein [Neisseria montereyensis]|uniref:Uncharacterized protein n=1 Tax=Neisseria montereyensis TaxID=2973938 RepID=A0ABT2FAX2_9NEIS|nr:hypothetical protein [Neisseria montereyensis]MCS4532889.1 hypothetical protein [Neisseria montereyensis]